MSSFTRMNYRQPVDFVKIDHMILVERLRKLELKLASKRRFGVIHYDYRQNNDGMDYGSSSMDDCCYPRTDEEFSKIDRALEDFYFLLCNYYIYQENYLEILAESKKEQLPIDWKQCTHDGFWGRDPTR